MQIETHPLKARKVAWPSLRQQANRAGLRLRWDVIGPDGEVLVEATEHPLADAALAMLMRGASPDALVTLRHEAALRTRHPANIDLDDLAGVEVAAGQEGPCFATVGACDAH